MADNIFEPKISNLKHTLCAQQSLLQKLLNELDAEREASASAASEALAVILRLQAEKAAVKLESEQYKRLSEEKMSHAEESLAIMKDIIYHKDMEIAALGCQVQAYRYKLLSMGCNDFVVACNAKFRKCPYRVNGILERPILGPCCFEFKNDSCSLDSSDGKTDQSVDSHWGQVRKLEEIPVADCTANPCDFRDPPGVNMRVEKRATLPQPTRADSSYRQDKVVMSDENSANLAKNNVGADFPCPNVLDVFVVPPVEHSSSSPKSWEDDEKETSGEKKELKPINFEKELSERSRNASIDRRLAVGTCFIESRNGCCQLDGASEIVKVEKTVESVANRDEGLKLLKEIKGSLNSLNEEIRGLKVKKPSKKEEPYQRALSEAMVYFWL